MKLFIDPHANKLAGMVPDGIFPPEASLDQGGDPIPDQYDEVRALLASGERLIVDWPEGVDLEHLRVSGSSVEEDVEAARVYYLGIVSRDRRNALQDLEDDERASVSATYAELKSKVLAAASGPTMLAALNEARGG